MDENAQPDPVTPEGVITGVLRDHHVISGAGLIVQEPGSQLADAILRELQLAGFTVASAEDLEVLGSDVTDGAGPDSTCGCGEPVTYYDGVWMHVFNPELRGTDDHDAHPDDDFDASELEDDEDDD